MNARLTTGEPRIISLVPSITELVCELGLAEQLVGRTGFCIHPWEVVRHIPKVGGTKDVKLERIRELRPTHVIVNIDENPRAVYEALTEFVPEVIITHPLCPQDNLVLYRELGEVFDRSERAEQLCDRFTTELDRLKEVPRTPEQVLYLIWREPWMTVSPATYISQMLALIGWYTLPRPLVAAALNAAASSSVQGPGPQIDPQATSAPERYPQIDPRDYAGQVSRVLLSSEPYHFKERHIGELASLLPGAQVSLIDGELISWYGSRAIHGLPYLGGLR